MNLYMLFVSLFINLDHGFYLPGTGPRTYKDTDEISIKSLKMTSIRTQIPFDYYYLPFCRPEILQGVSESLGELIIGDIIHNTPYILSKKSSYNCKLVCSRHLSEREKTLFFKAIHNDYKIHWILDNLNVISTKEKTKESDGHRLEKGFKIGKIIDKKKGLFMLHNHLDIKVLYHRIPSSKEKRFSIVRFEVNPKSFLTAKKCLEGQSENNGLILQGNSGSKLQKVDFTYSVEFISTEKEWKTRWEPYFEIKDSTLHWVTFLGSIVPVAAFSFLVILLILKALRKDLNSCTDLINGDREAQIEESGWKVLHGDVFRAPKHSTLLCFCLGAGFQVLAMSVIMAIFCYIGAAAPTRRGSIPNAFLFLFVTMAFVGGYASNFANCIFGRENYKLVSLYSAILFPGINVTVFMLLELLLWAQESSAAVSFQSILKLLFLWGGISLPLSVIGGLTGHNKGLHLSNQISSTVNVIPRQIPKKFNESFISRYKYVLTGAIPFLLALLEIHYLMNSLWLDQFYFMVSGFLAILILVNLISCEIAIIMCYNQLCEENYEWWWKAFVGGGSSGLFLFLYGIIYGFLNLRISSPTALILYFGYMFLLSFALFLLAGSLSVAACFFFLVFIYGRIKSA